nr:helix-turn-helix domain-containing protein [Streptomyces sp. S3(2020)]
MRRLRQAAGLSLAGLADRLKTGKGYLSRLERGLQRPSEAFARACDQALGADHALLALAVGPGTGQCPYPGLTSFRREDARWFFGRERAVADLLGLLADPCTAGHPAVVIGPSGIGKSSLLRAGLAAAVARGALPESRPGTPAVGYLTPTARPLEQLHAWGEGLSPDSYSLVIVDQFEELFALCAEESERAEFIGELCGLAAGGLPVAIGLRADFYGHCLAHPPLLAALRARTLPLGPMGHGELRQAIIEPAAAAGLALQPGLVEVLLRDLGAVGSSGMCEAAALPLLSHALRATWQQRVDGTLTVDGYERTGGVHGAVAATAERVHGRLPRQQQDIACGLLLNLVHVGEGSDDTRSRSGRDELIELTAAGVAGARAEDVASVVEAFTRARLLTADADHVEISHEALLWAWPRLREWIDGDRARLRLHQRLTEAARVWHEEGRDDSLLLRGARLATVSDWLDEQAGAHPVLRSVEREFLHACRVHEEAARAAERRRNRRLRRLVGALAVFLAVALVSGLLAVLKSHEAERRTDEARGQQHRALAALLSNEAARLADARPEVSALLATAAYQHDRTAQSLGALLSTQAQGFLGRLSAPAHQDMLWSASLSDDGRTLAGSDNSGRVVVWDVRRRKPIQVFDSLPEKVHAAAISPDGTKAAGIGLGGTLWLWDARSGRQLASAAVLPSGSASLGVLEFSRDGSLVAVAGAASAEVRLVDGLKEIGSLPSTAPVKGLALHPDGRTVAGAGEDGKVRVWRRSADGSAATARELDGGTRNLFTTAFNRDGTLLAAAGRDGVIRLWRTSDWKPAGALEGHHGEVWRIAFRPDGQVLASAGEDQQVMLWDISTRRRLASLGGHTASAHTVSFSLDGRLASGSSDQTIALWDTTGWISDGCATGGEPARAAAYGPGGVAVGSGDTITFRRSGRCHTLRLTAGPVRGLARGAQLVAVGGDAGAFRVWDPRRPGRPFTLDPRTKADGYRYQYGVAVSPDDAFVAVGGYSNLIRSWNMSAGHPVPLRTWAAGGTVWALAFSPDHRTLAVGADCVVEFARLGGIAGPQRFAFFSTPVTALAYGDGGRTLAVGSQDGTVELWDVSGHSRTLTLTPHQGAIRALHFAPNGNRMAVVGELGSVRWWALDPDRALSRACRTASAPSPQEWQRLLPDVDRTQVLRASPCRAA